ncbi:MAG: hypothetical protein H7066_19840 [Cytophagaceae bacterium]|nr:hypothetical protein [Gemmatimonadaceae bacterium]
MHYRLFVASLLCAGALPAQAVRPLPRADADFAEPFTSLSGIRELTDGRVLTIDRRDKLVQLVDFKAKTVRQVGREGSGPKEYALPMSIIGLPGDTSLVYDPLNSRSLVILPNGEPGDFVSMQAGARGPGGGMMVSMSPPRYADARGRLYSAGSAFTVGPHGPTAADSAPILRLDRRTQKIDTVAWVRVPKGNVQTSGTSGQMSVRIGGASPFAARDEWFVLPDGRVGIVRSPEYRVDWPGTRATGTPIPYDKIKVTEAHKQAWRDSRKNQTSIAVTMNNGQRSVRSGGATPTIPEPTDWPELLPPILAETGESVFIAPSGQVWISRARPGTDRTPNYDVLDATGKVAFHVELPERTRVIGFGNGTVYTIRTDEDDLQYLQRHRMP